MINSMTGYGEAQGKINGVCYSVEIKSVNNRYLKSSIKVPDSVAFLEEDIEKLLRKNLARGTVNYVLRLKNAPASTLFDVNEIALREYAERLGKIASSASIDCRLDIGSLLTLPGILMPASPDEKTAKQIKEKVLGTTQTAINQLKQMRAAEGVALAADLKKHCKAMREDIKRIRARSTVVLEEYKKKLKKRVDELLAGAKLKLDKATLAREVAIFAERSDISEELARLDSHLQQFAESAQTNEQSGRRLDFIGQEMLREANTIASKASDSKITLWVVNIKCRIDRIKEQVQNIE